MVIGLWNWLNVPAIILALIFITYARHVWKYRKPNLKGKHVLVTGGSKGIGKHIAIEAIKLGANVSIVARNIDVLEEAKNEIIKQIIYPNDQQVICIPVDVSGPFEIIQQAVNKAESLLGPVSVLVNNAGYCRAAKMEDTPVDLFKDMMQVNYIGAVQMTQCVVKGMKSRNEGKILFISSDAGLCGVFGFTSYSATKFALRGLAEALAMELKPYNVTVTVSCPPDTETPGFVEENKDKPDETRQISETAGLCSAESVANSSLLDTLDGKFYSTKGAEGFLQAMLCVGMAPFTSWLELIVQVLAMGFIRLISVYHLAKFDRIVRNGMKSSIIR